MKNHVLLKVDLCEVGCLAPISRESDRLQPQTGAPFVMELSSQALNDDYLMRADDPELHYQTESVL